ncbi:MAG: hypothetical protein ACM3IJ_00300 [Candidatus Levyibacteriota bacterium]
MTNEKDRRSIEKAMADQMMDPTYRLRRVSPDGTVLARKLTERQEGRMAFILSEMPELFDPERLEPLYRQSMAKPLTASPYDFCQLERAVAWDQTAMNLFRPFFAGKNLLERETDPVWRLMRQGFSTTRHFLITADFDKPYEPLDQRYFEEHSTLYLRTRPEEYKEIPQVVSCPVPDHAQTMYRTAFTAIRNVRQEEIQEQGGKKKYDCKHQVPNAARRLELLVDPSGDLLSSPL